MTQTAPEIKLRALEPADIDMVYRWENDPRLWPMGDNAAPMSRYQLHQYIENYSADIFTDRQLRLVITLAGNGTAVGAVDLFEFDPINSRAGVGIFVDEPYRRQGIAAAALSHLAGYCRSRLSLHSLWCIVAADNTPSLGLFAKAGFNITGRLKSWLRAGGKFGDAYMLQFFHENYQK